MSLKSVLIESGEKPKVWVHKTCMAEVLRLLDKHQFMVGEPFSDVRTNMQFIVVSGVESFVEEPSVEEADVDAIAEVLTSERFDVQVATGSKIVPWLA